MSTDLPTRTTSATISLVSKYFTILYTPFSIITKILQQELYFAAAAEKKNIQLTLALCTIRTNCKFLASCLGGQQSVCALLAATGHCSGTITEAT